MVRDHVPQRTSCFIKVPAAADIKGLGDSDLDVIDMVTIPDRFKHAVSETQDQDILDGLFAEIMIDPVDLVFVDEVQQIAIQRARRSEVRAKRLLDDQAPPSAF